MQPENTLSYSLAPSREEFRNQNIHNSDSAPNFVILSNQKPAKGQPCNGCGFCCQNEACELSVEFLNSTVAPCVALEWDGESKYRCGLVIRPAHYLKIPSDSWQRFSDLFGKMLGVGRGCDSDAGRS